MVHDFSDNVSSKYIIENGDRYLDPRDLQEMLSSHIKPSLIKLNIASISGNAVFDHLLVSKDIPRTNTGQITDGFRRIYDEAADGGGWVFFGNLDSSTLEKSEFCCYKPRNPRKSRDGKLIKYENPPKLPLGLYLPRISNEAAYDIFQKYEDIAVAPVENPTDLLDDPNGECKVFWGWVKTHSLPMHPTEGIKKTLCLLSHGLIPLGLVSVTGWNNPKTAVVKDCIKPFLTVPRQFTFVWDMDKSPKTVAYVNTQKAKFSLAIVKSGSTACDAKWHHSLGKGCDDVQNWEFIEGAIAGAKPSAVFSDDEKTLADIWEKVVSQDGGIKRNKQIIQFIAVLSDPVTQEFYKDKAKKLGLTKQSVERAIATILGKDKDSDVLPQDIGLQLAEHRSKTLRFSYYHKAWMCYESEDKGVFTPTDDGAVMADIQAACLNLDINPNNSFRENVLGTLKAQNFDRRWAESTEKIPFQNGVLNLATGELSEHTPDNRLTWVLPREYSIASGEFPVIDKWLNEFTSGRKKDRAIIEAFLAALIRGMVELQKALLVTGSGGNGKGILLDLAEKLVGSRNTWSGSIQDLEKDHKVAELQGKRLARFDDQETFYGNWQVFKNLTGNSNISGCVKFKDPVSFKPTCLAMISGNKAIAGGGAGKAYMRRIIHIESDFVPAVVNPNLDKEIEPELSAYTQFLLSIPVEQINKVLLGSASKTEISPVSFRDRISKDSLVAWINDRIVRDEAVTTQLSLPKDKCSQSEYSQSLFADYLQYIADGNYKGSLSLQNFSTELANQFDILSIKAERKKTNRGSAFVGVRVRSQFDEHPTFLEEVEKKADLPKVTPVTPESDTLVTPLVTPSKPLPHKESDTSDTLNPINCTHEKNNNETGNDTHAVKNEINNISHEYIITPVQVSPVSPSSQGKGLEGVTTGVTGVSLSGVTGVTTNNYSEKLVFKKAGKGSGIEVSVSAFDVCGQPLRVQSDLDGSIISITDADTLEKLAVLSKEGVAA